MPDTTPETLGVDPPEPVAPSAPEPEDRSLQDRPEEPITQDPLLIPIPSESESEPEGDSALNPTDLPAMGGPLFAQAMAQLAGTGVVAQNNFATVNKALDYDFMENKRMVTLDEAVGVREVQSQVNPGGPAPR